MVSGRSARLSATAVGPGSMVARSTGRAPRPQPAQVQQGPPEYAELLRLQRLVGNASVSAILAPPPRLALPRPVPPPVVQRATPSVTGVTVPGAELGVGRQFTARASVSPGTPASTLSWSLVGNPANVTIVSQGLRARVVSAPPVPGVPVGGTSFTVQVGLTGAAPVVSSPVMLVEVTNAVFNPSPAFGGPFATAIGSAAAPPNTADPNRGGISGNTAAATVTTAPAGRPFTLALRGAPGGAVAGTSIRPGAATGNQTVRVADTATGTFIDVVLPINSVPTRVSGFGAQTSAMPAQYGGWNTVVFAASDPSGAGSRPIAEIITVQHDDFGFGAPMGGAGAPSLAFSAPANNWTDLNGTPTTIDVNRFEGPGVPALPRQILYRQQFFLMSWTGTFSTVALGTGTHRRTLLRVGGGHVFRTEQIFPGASAPPMNDAYAGPPLIVLSGVTATPNTPGATALAADGVSTANVTVATTVPAGTVNWSVVSGGSSLAITTGAAGNPVGTPAVVTATATPGRARLRVADTGFPNRRGEGTVRVAPVALHGMAAAPGSVPAGVTNAVVTVIADPGGRVVDFSLDGAASAAGVTLGAPAPGFGPVWTVIVTRPAGFTGRVVVTAADHVLTGKTARTSIRFR